MSEITCPNDSFRRVLREEIPIPKFNELPFEKAQKQAKANYLRARIHVDEQQAKEKKAQIPLNAFYYAVKMTFGEWRLTGPAEDQDKSPLDMVLDLLKPYIIPALWSQFKRQFKKLMIQSFSSIYHSNYNPVRVREKNDQIEQTLKEFALKEYDLHLEFVLHPDTAEFFLSPRFLEIRSKIREYLTGQPLDKSLYQRPPQADDPRQMDMHLDIQVTSRME